MSDRKLREVAIAHYVYRHEAEFAAGFLDEAEIPYRLQVDDPSFGVAISSTATIWVRGIDAERARGVLELDDRPAYLTGAPGRTSTPAKSISGNGSDRPAIPAGGTSMTDRGELRLTEGDSGRLSMRERVLALLGSGGAILAGQALLTETSPLLLQRGLPLLAAFLAILGLVGWAPSFVRRVLSALSGNAP